MNPWMIIGWIVLALLVISLAFCGMVAYNVADLSGRTSYSTSMPVSSAEVVMLLCDDEDTLIQVRNVGNHIIAGAVASVRWPDRSKESIQLEPRHIGAGGSARGSAPGRGEGCALDSLVDGQGRSLVP